MSGDHGSVITPTHSDGTPINSLNPEHIHLFTANLTPNQVVPSITGSSATGTANLVLNEEGNAVEYKITLNGIDFGELLGGTAKTPDAADDVTALSIFTAPRGSNGTQAFNIVNATQKDDDLTFSYNTDGSVTLNGIWEATEQPLSSFINDLRSADPLEDVPLYINVQTEGNPNGEIRGQVVGDLLQIGPEIRLAANPEFVANEGIVRSFIRYKEKDVPLEVGMQFNAAALDPNNLPEDLAEYHAGEFQIPLPHPDNETVFNLLTWTWVAGPNGANPNGHGPDGVFDIDHFDFHFYLNTQEVRDTIDVFDSPDNYAKAITLPPPGFRPEEYKRPIDRFGNAIGVAPGDGSHWNNAFGPEFKQPPPPTHYQFFESSGTPFGPGYTIQYGYYEGIQTLLEPMVTPDFLRSKQDAQISIPQPDKYFKTGYFPKTYEVRYQEGAEFPYEVVLKDLEFHQASPVPEEANQAPTDIVLNNTTIYDNTSFLTLVGKLNTIDPHGPYNVVDDHVYALPFGIQGSGLIDDAGGRFFVNGNEIRVSEGADIQAGQTYQIVVRSVDTGGLSIEKPINITVEDLPEPTPDPLTTQQQILLQGTQAWNDYRTANPNAVLNVSGVDVPPIVNSNRGPTSFNLSGVNLSNTDLTGSILESVNLSNANLQGAKLNGVFAFGANLSGADLSGADLSGADLSGVNFAGANLSNANLTGAFLTAGANLTGANLTGANLTNADLILGNLTNANLTGANLTGASLRLNNVTGANLTNANLTNANLFGVDLTKAATTAGATLPGNPPPPTAQAAILLQGTDEWNEYRAANPTATFDLSGVDLPAIPGTGFNLRGVNLSGVNLSNAFLEFVDFSGANLSGANLEGARLFGANLTNANLSNAQLDDTFLVGTNLTNTNFSGADLDNAILSGSTQNGTNFSDANLSNTQFRFVNQQVGRQVAQGEIAPVNFKNADLTNAAFRLALLRDANLKGANIGDAADVYGADFTGADIETTDIKADSDRDGILDSIENGARNNGDGNNDGIRDSQQANVVSLPKANGSPTNPDDFLTLAAPKTTKLSNVKVQELSDLSVAVQTEYTEQVTQKQVNSDIGFLDFQIEGQAAGASTTATLFLPSGNSANTYWMYGSEPGNATPHWFEFGFDGDKGTGASFVDSDKDGKTDRVVLHFVDGERGDRDLTKNGIVTNSGTPGVAANATGKLTPTAQKIFVTEGTAGFANYQFAVTQNEASFSNELGVFVVDDDNGTVNGIAPGADGYVKAALAKAQTIFSVLPDNLLGEKPTRQVSLPAGQRLMFYLVQNGTTEQVLSGTTNTPNVFFGLSSANDDNFDPLQVFDAGNGVFKLGWEDMSGGGDRDFNDLELTVQPTDPNSNISAAFQGKKEVIDLRDKPVDSLVSANLTVKSEAAFNNSVGFYAVNDVRGTITDALTGRAITPDEAGYAEAAVRQSVLDFDRNGTPVTNLPGGTMLAPYLITNGTPDTFLEQNADNTTNSNNPAATPLAYFAYLGANPDRVDHVRLLGDNTFGFEDLFQGGDFDYNDMVVKMNIA